MTHASSSASGAPDASLAPHVGPGVIAPGTAWAVGVSGGADSVALLWLLRSHRPDLRLHVAHLDHETRSGESAADAAFVADLCRAWTVPCTVARLRDLEVAGDATSRNRAERFREARLRLFRDVALRHALAGVLLGHHAGDQAETVLQRLLRGAGPGGLTGIAPRATIHGLTIVRPLLGVAPSALRTALRRHAVAWREDATNALPIGQRNRIRPLLAARPEVAASLVELARACDSLVGWLRDAAPRLAEEFRAGSLDGVPGPLAREAARRWLATRAGPGVEIPSAAVDRLLEMTRDAASPPRQHFPGGVLVRRRGGMISAAAPSSPSSPSSPARSSAAESSPAGSPPALPGCRPASAPPASSG